MAGKGSRGCLGVLDAYLTKEFLFSFLVAFLFFFVIFFVNQLLLMAEDILSKRAPLKDVLLLLLYATPSVVAMAVPFASLVGALMATGRLSSDNEFLVLEASGIPARRALSPFLVLGLLLSLLSFAANDYFLPLGTLEFGKLYRKLLVSAPAVELRPWSSRRYRDVTIVTGPVEGNEVRDILIFDRSEEGRERIISAEEARLVPDQGAESLVLQLHGVWTQTLKSDDSERFEYSTCDSMEYRLILREGDTARSSIGPREMSSFDLGRVIAAKNRDFQARLRSRAAEIETARSRLETKYFDSMASARTWEGVSSSLSSSLSSLENLERTAPTDRSLQVYRLEYYKKYSIPAGAFFFVLLAFPLGLKARRSGRSVGFGLGLLVAVIYWALLLGGQTLGARLGWSPFWAMWLPDLIILIAGLGLAILGRLRI